MNKDKIAEIAEQIWNDVWNAPHKKERTGAEQRKAIAVMLTEALTQDAHPDRFDELEHAIDEHCYERGFVPMMCPTEDKVVWVEDIHRIIKEVKEMK